MTSKRCESCKSATASRFRLAVSALLCAGCDSNFFSDVKLYSNQGYGLVDPKLEAQEQNSYGTDGVVRVQSTNVQPPLLNDHCFDMDPTASKPYSYGYNTQCLSQSDTLGTTSSELDKMNKKETTEKYKRVKYLGCGSFGEVWLVENNVTKEEFAMKCIERGQKFDKYMAREIIIQKSLCHSNIIQFKEVVLNLSYLGIVMEYAAGGDLHDKIFTISSKKGLDEYMARYYFHQLISGVSYLHTEKDTCHRDLKPGNILLDGSDPPRLKICDFGYSKSGRLHSKPRSAVGTLQYSAPEVREREYNGKLADLWSCGVILYNMLVGEHPSYRPNDTGETSNVYETNACPFSLPDSLSPYSKDLLARMLVADPRKRITIEDVKKHQWFKNLKRKLPEATQVPKENPRVSLQSDEEIEKIVKEAKIRPPEDAIVME